MKIYCLSIMFFPSQRCPVADGQVRTSPRIPPDSHTTLRPVSRLEVAGDTIYHEERGDLDIAVSDSLGCHNTAPDICN